MKVQDLIDAIQHENTDRPARLIELLENVESHAAGLVLQQIFDDWMKYEEEVEVITELNDKFYDAVASDRAGGL